MLHRYLRHLGTAAADHVVVSLVPVGAVGRGIRALGVTVLSAGQAPGRPSLGAFARLRTLIARCEPDVIHGWMYHGNLAASVAAVGSPRARPVVWGVHHSLEDLAREPRMTRWVIRASARLSRRTAAIAYCSRVSADQHEAVGFAAERRLVVPNGVDTAEFRPRDGARARLKEIAGIPGEPVILGNVARDHPMKNQAALVRAVAALAGRGLDVHAVIVGEGQSTGAAARETERLGIKQRVSLLETRSDIGELVPGFDVFVLPSAWGEAFPLSVGEAMACEVPAVVTDVGDCAWLVGETGTVVPPREDERLITALDGMVRLSPEARRSLGRGGRKRVETHFAMERYAASHAEIYRRAVDDRRASST